MTERLNLDTHTAMPRDKLDGGRFRDDLEAAEAGSVGTCSGVRRSCRRCSRAPVVAGIPLNRRAG